MKFWVDPPVLMTVDKVYVPTKLNGSLQVVAEHLTDYGYDSRHRLTTIDQTVCQVDPNSVVDIHACTGAAVTTGSDDYSYDDNDNRIQVIESNSGGTASTTNYCYDAVNRLIAAKVTSACTSGPTETNTYDPSSNRTQAVTSSGTTNFAYNSAGQLCKIGATSCGTPNVTHDAAGRTQSWNGWTFAYDGGGRLAAACKVAGCATGDKVTMRYDGQGRRVELMVRPSGGSATTTTFRYQGETVVQELTDTGGGPSVTREYVADEQGAIVKVCDPNCVAPTKTYLVTYNGHGDAMALWQINPDGSLTLSNSYSYDTWGAPTTRNAAGSVLAWSDAGHLHFRFLYVGGHRVQWDDLGVGLGLAYMHARHYSPALGRFLEPDPIAAEPNSYAYAATNPVTNTDARGTWGPAICLAPPIAPICVKVTADVVITVWGGVLLLVGVSTQVKSDTTVRVTPKTAPPAKHGCWVIGEGMWRVREFANPRRCFTMPDLPKSAETGPARFEWLVGPEPNGR